MKLFAAAPLLSQIAARDLYAQAASAIGRDPRQNVYTRLGVKTVINCRGTWTYLSGSLEFPEVRQAQVEAAQHFVNMLELQRAVGKRLAELTGAESHHHFGRCWCNGRRHGRLHGRGGRQTSGNSPTRRD
jgi:L-seryl-tRNA(Ser) seleniumtransferase